MDEREGRLPLSDAEADARWEELREGLAEVREAEEERLHVEARLVAERVLGRRPAATTPQDFT